MNQNILTRLGIKIGHYTDHENLTGLTCFIAEKGARIGIDVRGSWPGTLSTSAYGPKGSATECHGIVLTGGSIFGLESAFGLIQYLAENDIGEYTPAGVIPEVVGAVIYDIAVGNGEIRPTKMNGYMAAKNANSNETIQGNIGVGTGATVGKWFAGKRMKGGFGIGCTEILDGILVCAFAVTNCVGDVINPKTGKFFSESGQQELLEDMALTKSHHLAGLISLGRSTNTTLAVIATNAGVDKNQLMKIAEQAHNGMARSVHPIHTSMDGDTVFAISSLSGEQKKLPKTSAATVVDLLGIAAAQAITKAINNSMVHAKSIEGYPAYEPC